MSSGAEAGVDVGVGLAGAEDGVEAVVVAGPEAGAGKKAKANTRAVDGTIYSTRHPHPQHPKIERFVLNHGRESSVVGSLNGACPFDKNEHKLIFCLLSC